MSGLFSPNLLPHFRHGVKPRLFRLFWRAFTSTYPLMLPSTSPRDDLLACPPFPHWNLPSFTVESTLSFPCSHSDPLFLAKVQLSLTLTLSHPTTWCSGQTAVFLFILSKAVLAYLPSALSVALRPLFSFSAGPVCSSFFTKACAIKQALCWSWQHQQVCHFTFLLFLCDSHSVLITLFSSPSFLLPQCFWQKLSFLFSCSIRLQWVPRCLFLQGNDTADELARRGALLVFSAISCSLFPLISCIHLSLFLDWRCTVSSTFFDTQAPLIFTEELVLLHHACCVLFGLRFNGHSLLLSSYFSRIGRIKNLSCSTCGHSSQDTTHLILHCPATDSASLALW